MRIRSKLMLAFLAVSLPAMILISLLFYSNEQKTLTRQIFNHLESVASIQQNRIQAISDQNIVRLKLVASRTQLRVSLRDFYNDGKPEHTDRIKRILADTQIALADFKKIFILLSDGTVIVSTDPEIIGINMSKIEFFIRGQTEFRGDYFFLNKNRKVMTYLSGPLILDNQLLGVLVIESAVENIISSVSDYTGLKTTGETILARPIENGNARLIMPTRFDPHAALKLSIPKDWFETPIIGSGDGKSRMLSGVMDYRGVPVLAVTRYIEELDWGIAVKIDQAEAFAPVFKMRNIIVLLIAGAALIIVAISIYLSKNITRPISRLTQATRNISNGNYSAQADESTKGEIGILARGFNSMTTNLIQSQKSLENKISELSESEEQIRNLLNSTAEAICGLDKNGNCTFCNPSLLRMLGYKKDSELLGKNIHRLIHHTRPDGTEYPSEECRILKLLKNKNPVHIDDEVLWRADGSSFWAEYWAYPVLRDDEITGAVVTFIDISERKLSEAEKEKLNAQLIQVQKLEAVGTLAGGIAHDFNNILSAVIGYAELARMKLAGRDDILKDVDAVIQAGERAKELVRQILTFSRQSMHVRRPLEVHLIVKEALKLLRASIPATIEIREKIDKKSGAVLADPTQIHQVLMNLCTNAYHAMRETGGILTVELNRAEIASDGTQVNGLKVPPGSYVRLRVSDTGCGMRRSVIERIFEPYFTTKDKGEGTGMGLSLTHGIVKNHDGHIFVDSEPGKGTTFRVYFPRIMPDAIKPSLEGQKALTGGSERILIVDDEQSIVLMEQRMLENLGYQVTATSNCLEAFQLFVSRPDNFDLLITDMSMPQMSGADLARKVLSVRPDMPVVLCTGFSELIDENTAREIGIREYVMKPVGSRQIATIVRKLLDEKNTSRMES